MRGRFRHVEFYRQGAHIVIVVFDGNGRLAAADFILIVCKKFRRNSDVFHIVALDKFFARDLDFFDEFVAVSFCQNDNVFEVIFLALGLVRKGEASVDRTV